MYNRLALGYDIPALRFFPFGADRLVARLHPMRGAKVLDVGTGTGAVALAVAIVSLTAFVMIESLTELVRVGGKTA